MKLQHGFAVIALVTGVAASAADLFRVTATVNGTDTGSRAYMTANEVFESLTDVQLRGLVPTYTGVDATTLSIFYRGMTVDAAYGAHDTALDFNVPVLGISETFNGVTREESRRMLREYLKNGDTVGRIMALLAATSPVDPIAGNPASLQTRMVTRRFRQDFANLARARAAASLGGGKDSAATPPATLGSAELGRHTRGGLSSTTVGIPFSHALDIGPDRPWSIDGELQFTDTEGAETYGVQVGSAYRWRMNERWYLVPGAALGFSGSRDLGAVGTILATSLSSALRLVDSADYTLWMGNALNWSRTLKTTIKSYSSDPKLENWALTNGLQLSFSPGALVRGHWVELALTDSRYFGSDLYDRRYDEIAVSLVQARGGSTLRYELSYLNASHSRAFAARFHLSF